MSTKPEDRLTSLGAVNLRSSLAHNLLPQEDVREVVRREVGIRRSTIKNLHEQIAELQTIHNLVAPVNNLPPELLSMTFAYVEAGSTGNKDLITITHVCRHWRDIALQAPVLWTRIALKHPEGVRTFLDRSKALPLTVSLSTDQLPIVATVRSLTAEIHRTRSLKVCIPPSLALDVVAKKLMKATPQLEELWIEKLPTPRGSRLAQNVSLEPPMVFDGAPLLRSLVLRGMNLPYLPLGPCALTNISLEDLLPPPAILLDLLDRCPSLERLRIHGPFNVEEIWSARSVRLSHLKTLEIHTFPPVGIATFLPSLILPKETNISIFASLDLGENFSEIMPPYVPGHVLPMECLKGLKRLQLVWAHHELTLHAYRGQDEFHTPALQVRASMLDPRPGARFFGDWPIDTAHIETLVVCGSFSRRHPYDFATSRERWANMLQSLPALRTLRMMTLSSQTLDDFAMEFACRAPQPACPHLEVLEIFDATPGTNFWTGLLAALTSRSPGAGGCLSRMEFWNVGQLKSTTWSMQEIVNSGVKLIVNESEIMMS
ncbi:hypothetical protein C2E23DRAFT_881283 [Lenzites betulinus]|nr:hypothetical protein C2E23DRAFT_881283 [Lenzites betulinus]